jgi:hypothetical protein
VNTDDAKTKRSEVEEVHACRTTLSVIVERCKFRSHSSNLVFPECEPTDDIPYQLVCRWMRTLIWSEAGAKREAAMTWTMRDLIPATVPDIISCVNYTV